MYPTAATINKQKSIYKRITDFNKKSILVVYDSKNFDYQIAPYVPFTYRINSQTC